MQGQRKEKIPLGLLADEHSIDKSSVCREQARRGDLKNLQNRGSREKDVESRKSNSLGNGEDNVRKQVGEN